MHTNIQIMSSLCLESPSSSPTYNRWHMWAKSSLVFWCPGRCCQGCHAAHHDAGNDKGEAGEELLHTFLGKCWCQCGETWGLLGLLGITYTMHIQCIYTCVNCITYPVPTKQHWRYDMIYTDKKRSMLDITAPWMLMLKLNQSLLSKHPKTIIKPNGYL